MSDETATVETDAANKTVVLDEENTGFRIFAHLSDAVRHWEPGDGSRIYEVRAVRPYNLDPYVKEMETQPVYIIAKTNKSAITAMANMWREGIRHASSAEAVGTIELITAMKEVAS